MCSQSQATSQPSLPFFPLFGLQYTPSFRNRFSHLQKLWERYFLRCTGCPLHNTIITLCSQNNLVVKDTNNVKGDYSVFIFFYLKIPQMFNILATCNLGVSTKYFYQFHNTFKIKLKTRFHIDSLFIINPLFIQVVLFYRSKFYLETHACNFYEKWMHGIGTFLHMIACV